MFKTYGKTLLTALVVMGWLWTLSFGMEALNSRSDIGVALGVVGVISSTFLAIALVAQIHKKRTNHEEDVESRSDGGAGAGS